MTTQAVDDLLRRCPSLASSAEDIKGVLEALTDTFSRGGKVLLCGNGGSASDADHIAGELMKGFLLSRRLPAAERARFSAAGAADLGEVLQGALPAVALTGPAALLTAVANDTSGTAGFAQQVYGLGRPGDALLGLSTSGNSENILSAFRVARLLGLTTILLSGKTGGRIRPWADHAICVPETSVPRVQELHLPVYHALCADLETRFFGEPDSEVVRKG